MVSYFNFPVSLVNFAFAVLTLPYLAKPLLILKYSVVRPSGSCFYFITVTRLLATPYDKTYILLLGTVFFNCLYHHSPDSYEAFVPFGDPYFSFPSFCSLLETMLSVKTTFALMIFIS